MLNYLLTALSLLFWYSPDTAPDAVFSSAFEEQMHISTDRPTTISWSITSSNANAALSAGSSFAYLQDGKVSTPTRMTWDIGSQTTGNFTRILAGFLTPGIPVAVGQVVVFAVLCPKTLYTIPAGVEIDFVLVSGAGPNIVATGYTVTFGDGSVGLVMAHALTLDDISGATDTWTQAWIQIHNNTSVSATWAASGQVFDIGEFWFGTAEQFNLTTDPKRKIMGGPTERRSHNNTDQPLFQKSYYQWTFNFTPMNDTAAFDSSAAPSYSSVEYTMTHAKAVLMLPRIYKRGTTTIDTVALNQLAIFGRVTSVAELAAIKDGPYWIAGVVMGQAPP